MAERLPGSEFRPVRAHPEGAGDRRRAARTGRGLGHLHQDPQAIRRTLCPAGALNLPTPPTPQAPSAYRPRRMGNNVKMLVRSRAKEGMDAEYNAWYSGT